MPKVYNPTEETVETRVFGSYFTFKPGQMKNMNQNFCDFIQSNRKDTGLVVLPAEFDPMAEEHYIEGFEKTTEGKAILAQKREEGIKNLIDFHLGVIRNNQVSLKKDLARHDPSNDPAKLAAIEASKGELESMRLVAKYKKMKLNSEDKRLNEVDKLLEEVGPIGN
jgi:hypothetical protein